MRGGAIPIFAWGVLLLVLFVGNTVWNGKLVDSIVSGGAALIIFALGAWLIARAGRRAVSKGPPEPSPHSEPVVSTSVGAAAAGLSLGCMLFGFAFGSFLIYFGAAMLALSLGRIAIEVRSERSTVRSVIESRGEGPAR